MSQGHFRQSPSLRIASGRRLIELPNCFRSLLGPRSTVRPDPILAAIFRSQRASGGTAPSAASSSAADPGFRLQSPAASTDAAPTAPARCHCRRTRRAGGERPVARADPRKRPAVFPAPVPVGSVPPAIHLPRDGRVQSGHRGRGSSVDRRNRCAAASVSSQIPQPPAQLPTAGVAEQERRAAPRGPASGRRAARDTVRKANSTL